MAFKVPRSVAGSTATTILVIGLGAAVPSLAAGRQTPQPVTPPHATRAPYAAPVQETLRKPADPATLVAFAEIAIKVGDLEGAISALDRLLLIDGDQPDIKLELGVLYFRLGSFEAARAYLEEVRASGRASPAVKERAAEFLKLAKRP